MFVCLFVFLLKHTPGIRTVTWKASYYLSSWISKPPPTFSFPLLLYSLFIFLLSSLFLFLLLLKLSAGMVKMYHLLVITWYIHLFDLHVESFHHCINYQQSNWFNLRRNLSRYSFAKYQTNQTIDLIKRKLIIIINKQKIQF